MKEYDVDRRYTELAIDSNAKVHNINDSLDVNKINLNDISDIRVYVRNGIKKLIIAEYIKGAVLNRCLVRAGLKISETPEFVIYSGLIRTP